MRTLFSSVPVMIKPPMRTLSSVRTCIRVEMLSKVGSVTCPRYNSALADSAAAIRTCFDQHLAVWQHRRGVSISSPAEATARHPYLTRRIVLFRARQNSGSR